MKNRPDRVLQTLSCAAILATGYTLSLLVGLLPNHAALSSSGLLMPVLCALEFAVVLPLYVWYTRNYSDMPVGRLQPRLVALFTLALLLILLGQSLLLPRESWVGQQFSENRVAVILFALSVGVLAPIYEEILFRGCLLQGLLQWAPQQRAGCSLLASLFFAAAHTQYVHLQTLVALVVLSLLLCAARLVSGGLKLPIVLHILNNLAGIIPWLWLTLNR